MLCPKFEYFSALFWISVIQIGVFITELAIGGVQETSLLAANVQTLEDMGQKVSFNQFKYRIFMALSVYLGPVSNAVQF